MKENYDLLTADLQKKTLIRPVHSKIQSESGLVKAVLKDGLLRRSKKTSLPERRGILNLEKNKVRWLYLGTGVISMFFAGILYAWSVLKSPLALKYSSETFFAGFGWDDDALSLNFSIAICAFCFAGVLGSILTKKIGYLKTVVLAGLLSGFGFVLTSVLLRGSDQLFLLYLLYGLVAGAGIGIAYNVVISTINAWFPDKKGLSSGCLMMGFGIGSLVLGLVAQSWFSTIGWSQVYLIFGIVMGVIIILSAIIIKTPPKEPAIADKKAESEDDGMSYSPKQMLASSLFWRAFIFVAVIVGIGTCTTSFAKDLSVFSGASQDLGALMAGIFSISNGIFRVVTGVVFDKFGRKRTMQLASVLSVSASILLILTTVTASLPLCFVALIIAGFTCGMGPTNASVIARDLFGKKYYGTNFGIMNCNMVVAAALSFLVGAVYKSTGGYVIPFVIFLALAVLGFIMNISINRSRKD